MSDDYPLKDLEKSAKPLKKTHPIQEREKLEE